MIYTAEMSGSKYHYNTPEEKLYAESVLDVDGNGAVTVEDAQKILLYYMTGLAGYQQDWNKILNS